MLDLETIVVEETGTLHLKNAAGDLLYVEGGKGQERKPVTVTVYGPGSSEYAKAQAKRTSKALALLRKKGDATRSPDEATADQAEFLSAITARFDNLSYRQMTGAEMARGIYSDRKLGFIADQVAEFVGEWENFSKGSATS